MTPTTFGIPLSTKDATWAVEQACLAPSVHNTQPWRFTWDGASYQLHADTARGLTASDPDGRELVMSCGAALFNLRLALRKLGYDADVAVLPDAGNPRLLARVTVAEAAPADPNERRAFAAMLRRHTHRGAFDDEPLAPETAVALQRAAELEAAELVFVADPGQRRRVLTLARTAERALVNDIDVQAEIADWTPAPTSGRRDGVPATAYAAEPVAQPDDLAPRDYDQGRGYGIGEAVENGPQANVRWLLHTDDAHGLYDQLKERGVTDFTQEPTEHFYGIDMGVRDPFGNPIRILQQGEAAVRREARKQAAKASA